MPKFLTVGKRLQLNYYFFFLFECGNIYLGNSNPLTRLHLKYQDKNTNFKFQTSQFINANLFATIMLSSILMTFLLSDLLSRKHSKQDFNKPKYTSVFNQFTAKDLLSLCLSDSRSAYLEQNFVNPLPILPYIQNTRGVNVQCPICNILLS